MGSNRNPPSRPTPKPARKPRPKSAAPRRAGPAHPPFAQLLKTAHDLADLSGDILRPYFRKPIAVTDKGRDGAFDPVTAADRAAERVIRRALAERWPAHGLVGEELGTTREEARLRWVIDPIDGTRAFIMGSPLWGTLIGLLDEGQPLLGLMDQPFTRERYWSDAKASYLRTAAGKARRLQTRACPRLADAVLCSTHPDLFEPGREIDSFARLTSSVRMTRYGGDCYSYCLLAAGFVDLVVEAGLKPHDIVALVPIIERAGGRVTTWTGGSPSEGGAIVAAGDARLHDAAVALLSR
jgi:myo-inositol-1(or 4)-monophosphatase